MKPWKSVITSLLLILSILILMGCSVTKSDAKSTIRLREWKSAKGSQGGIAVESTHEKAFVYLWFYEWHMFDAVLKGQHTKGSADWLWQVSLEQNQAVMKSPALSLKMKATNKGADLMLTITNKSDHDWPEIAAIIPCFNPGNKTAEVKESPLFLDKARKNTYFVGPDGLELLKQREIHFNDAIKSALDRVSPTGKFVFSHKWPTSDTNATAGLMVRESEDQKWVAGIAWENFLSAQGHNPWNCMHLSVLVGPLKRGESKKIRGKIYLFQGTKEDCLKLFYLDFTRKKK